MSLILSGTDGLSDIDGSAATPAIRGTDANTGIFFPAADTIAFAEGGVEAMRINSSGNVGIGTTSPATMLNLSRDSGLSTGAGTTIALQLADTGSDGGAGTWSTTQQFTAVQFYSADASGAGAAIRASVGATMESGSGGTSALTFFTNSSGTPAERARIDSSGNLLVGTTTLQGKFTVTATGSTTIDCARTETSNSNQIVFRNGNGAVGSITTNGAATAYNISSDYRLKNTIAPMTGALAKVSALNPVTYKWNVDGTDGEGFIAHELAEICPQAVSGQKDAVDENGKPQYQGIDVSFLVATLTAAIQEQQAIIESLKARLDAANL